MATTRANRRADHVGEQRTAYEKNRQRILATQSVCGICGRPVDLSIKNARDPMAPVIDHIIPINKGGHPSDINNLQLAHRWCNRQKSDMLFDVKGKFSAEAEIKNDDLPQHFDWKNYKASWPKQI